MSPRQLLTLGRLARPRLYSRGDDLPIGTYHVERVRIGERPQFVVVRTIGAARWMQLTARSNPAWRTWSTRDEAMRATADADGVFTCAEWPHWGRT